MENSPNKSAESLNKQQRQQVSGIINSDAAGIKPILYNFFVELNIGAYIGPHTNNITPILFEGPANLILRAKDLLDEKLIEKYPGVQVEWAAANDSTQRLSKVTIIETPSQFKRSISSGEFKEADLKELSVGASANTEFVKQHVKSAVIDYLAHLGGITGAITAQKEHITIIHHNSVTNSEVSFVFEISLMSFDMLRKCINEKFNLNAAIKMIYLHENNRVTEMKDIRDFKGDKSYFLLTEIDELPDIHNPTKEPKIKTIEAFYEALETFLTHPVKKAKQMEKVKTVFDEQDIEFAILKRLTEPKLEKMGFSIGISAAISSVIETL